MFDVAEEQEEVNLVDVVVADGSVQQHDVPKAGTGVQEVTF